MFRSILSALTLLFFSPLSAQFQPDIEKKIDSIMMHTYPLTDPGAVLLIAKNGVPVMEKGYGLANIELTVANKPKFVFAIGSMSKQFTAVCLLQLQDAGKLSLDDDIRKHLPHYDTHGETITIRHLLTHTSGIPSFTELDTFQHLINTDNSIADISNLFMNRPLLFSPGSNWSYSNSGYLLAGMIVEKVSGVTLETYLRQHIFLPLGMNSTSMGSNDRVIPRMVTGYDMGSYGYMPTREYSWIWTFGAGGIVSNTSDLLKWDEALY
jgi:CubicO group peptidase (beta-lactamase class C family)